MKNSYRSGMEKIKITDDMQRRILSNLTSETAPKPSRLRLWSRSTGYAAGLAFALLLVLVYIAPWRGQPVDPGGPNVSVGNPYVTYQSLDQLKKALPFTPKLPSGYGIDSLALINGTLVQIGYKGGFTYRTSQGSEDISGDTNEYKATELRRIGQMSVAMKGDGKLVHLATWTDGGFTFAVSSEAGLTPEQITEIVKSIE